MPSRAHVACGSCRLCCSAFPVPLIPEHDDVLSYERTLEMRDDKQVAFLKKKEDGACVYLGEGGCTIWERAPFACRYFDCRTYYHLGRSGLRPTNNDANILKRGKELLENDRGRSVVHR